MAAMRQFSAGLGGPAGLPAVRLRRQSELRAWLPRIPRAQPAWASRVEQIAQVDTSAAHRGGEDAVDRHWSTTSCRRVGTPERREVRNRTAQVRRLRHRCALPRAARDGRLRPRGARQSTTARASARKDKRDIPLDDSPSRGAPMAKVTIVEFSDFQCPHCGAAHPETHAVAARIRWPSAPRLQVFPAERTFTCSCPPRARPKPRARRASSGRCTTCCSRTSASWRTRTSASTRAQLGLDMERFERDWNAESTLPARRSRPPARHAPRHRGHAQLLRRRAHVSRVAAKLGAYIKEELEL